MVTQEDLKNADNLGQCECGNYAHWDYITSNEDGANSCPECQISYMTNIIDMYKKLLLRMASVSFSRNEIESEIKNAYAKLYGISEDDFDSLGVDIDLENISE